MKRWLFAGLVVVGGLLSSSTACGQPSAATSPTSESSHALTVEQPRSYYGWQTLLTDAVGLSLVALSGELGHSTIPAVVGAGSLLFGAPVMHALHHNWLGLGVSLGLRLGTGVALVSGLELVAASDGYGSTTGLVLLGCAVLGGLAALLLDAVLLGFEPRRPGPGARTVTLMPVVDPRGELALQLRATF